MKANNIGYIFQVLLEEHANFFIHMAVVYEHECPFVKHEHGHMPDIHHRHGHEDE